MVQMRQHIMVGRAEVPCENGQGKVHKRIGKFRRRGEMSVPATFFQLHLSLLQI